MGKPTIHAYSADGQDFRPSFLLVGVLFLFLSTTAFLLGALPGFFAALYAPANQPPNPFQAPFFRIVSGQTFLALLIACVFFYGNWIAVSIVTHLFSPPPKSLFIHNGHFIFIWLGGTFIGLVFGISRALRIAGNATKTLL